MIVCQSCIIDLNLDNLRKGCYQNKCRVLSFIIKTFSKIERKLLNTFWFCEKCEEVMI